MHRALALAFALALVVGGACSGGADRPTGRLTKPRAKSTSTTTPRAESSSTSSTLPSPRCRPPAVDAIEDGAEVLGAAYLSAPAGPVSPRAAERLRPSATEVFARVGAGASTDIVGVWQLQPETCEPVRLSGPDGRPSEFAIGGTVTHLGGLRCERGGLVLLSAESTDGETYETTETRLVVRDGAFTADGRPLISTLDAHDPALGRFASLQCPGVAPP